MIEKTNIWIGIILLGIAILVFSLDPEFSILDFWSDDLSRYRTSENLLVACVIYAVCIAIPFMPGVEIGLLIMLVFGEQGIVAAYLSTVLGLNAAFAVGRLSRCMRWNNLSFLGSMLPTIGLRQSDSDSGRLHKLSSLAEKTCGRFRYPVLALLFNMPGNSVIGGGGGIAMLSGMNRSFSWSRFALTVALATCLVPLLAYFGMINIEKLLNS